MILQKLKMILQIHVSDAVLVIDIYATFKLIKKIHYNYFM
jgi:hypothetical protein